MNTATPIRELQALIEISKHLLDALSNDEVERAGTLATKRDQLARNIAWDKITDPAAEPLTRAIRTLDERLDALGLQLAARQAPEHTKTTANARRKISEKYSGK